MTDRYQWQRSVEKFTDEEWEEIREHRKRYTGAWEDIPGANERVYIPTGEDVDHQLRFVYIFK